MCEVLHTDPLMLLRLQHLSLGRLSVCLSAVHLACLCSIPLLMHISLIPHHIYPGRLSVCLFVCLSVSITGPFPSCPSVLSVISSFLTCVP